jgi:hypothetical protein
VVSTNPSEKYDFVGWDDEIPNCFWKVIKFHGSKAPTSDFMENPSMNDLDTKKMVMENLPNCR